MMMMMMTMMMCARGIERSLQAFASIRAVRLFLRAIAVIRFILIYVVSRRKRCFAPSLAHTTKT